MADGGILFLDEVHCLTGECQEKLFLFMDQGIYHMIGDNETWYSSRYTWSWPPPRRRRSPS
ncbi:hypothetical protein KL86CLO1_10326 [uncultured Eubacteriales bacterium]|uniref:Sigma-54 factor interaction domain-containing protein n=1 Tax=uncultured Eubacteriales bacterium TaxID=172733 RepID=A0A212J0T4_9FIRM|nr:hypothetical protein KL86CLO1_10326 [uncultured Eubacteriales bacterium]